MGFVFNISRGGSFDWDNLPAGAKVRAALQVGAYLVEAAEQGAATMDALSGAFVEPTDPSYSRVEITGRALQITSNKLEHVADKAVFPALAGSDDIYSIILYLDPDGSDTEAQNVPICTQDDPAPSTTTGADFPWRFNGVDGVGVVYRGAAV
jgi:hypothetical protein